MNRLPRISDDYAAQVIMKMDYPLNQAVASIVWWDNISRQDMPLTFELMNSGEYPRAYPTSDELIAGLVAMGYPSHVARNRVIADSYYSDYSAHQKARMRKRRGK